MPIWVYHLSNFWLAVFIVVVMEVVSMIGLLLTRRLLIPRLHFHDGVSDAISGTAQAIGVFYGITVGLLAVGVWNTYSSSSNLVSNEATAIGVLYRDVSSYPEPVRSAMQAKLREFTESVINDDWPAQKSGRVSMVGAVILDELQSRLYSYEPASASMIAVHSETISAYNKLIEARRLRIDAVESHLSTPMWAVIAIGAAVSIAVAYLYKIQDLRLHLILIGLMAGFLGILVFMIVINDRPFLGYVSIPTDPYQLILDRVINRK